MQGQCVRGLLLALWLVIAGCGGGGGSGDGSNIGVNARVPNVVGQTQAAATSAITGAGLNVGTVTMTDQCLTVASGNVISQNPRRRDWSRRRAPSTWSCRRGRRRRSPCRTSWVRRRPRRRPRSPRRFARRHRDDRGECHRAVGQRDQSDAGGGHIGRGQQHGESDGVVRADSCVRHQHASARRELHAADQARFSGAFTLVEAFPNLPTFDRPCS